MIPADPASPDVIVKRSITIRGHRTSISIEDRFWQALREIAARRGLPLANLVARIDAQRADGTNLSSAIRLFVLDDALARARAVEAGPFGPPAQDQKSSGSLTPGSEG